MAFSPTPKQARRAFLLGIAGTSLLLSSCQTGPRGPIAGPIEPPLPLTDADRNLVAVIVPLTGADGPVGTSISNAARLALADTGEQTLKIAVYDSAGPGGAAEATTRAMDRLPEAVRDVFSETTLRAASRSHASSPR